MITPSFFSSKPSTTSISSAPLLSSLTHDLGIENHEELRMKRGLFRMKVGIAMDHVLSYKTKQCSVSNCKLDECECYNFHDEKKRLPLESVSRCKKLKSRSASFKSLEDMWEGFQSVFGEEWVIQRAGCSDIVLSVLSSEEYVI